ncbi:hypothetical protein [Geminocystis sp. NIES-3709]|uniref:hypothetical protein n=1 Tax=Geminocystis sp. NIES-3709 TaxID=1617448 RepID=UPI00118756DB|nr:hypothetical protein [Geminocystis sp. NIES-3709]
MTLSSHNSSYAHETHENHRNNSTTISVWNKARVNDSSHVGFMMDYPDRHFRYIMRKMIM